MGLGQVDGSAFHRSQRCLLHILGMGVGKAKAPVLLGRVSYSAPGYQTWLRRSCGHLVP